MRNIEHGFEQTKSFFQKKKNIVNQYPFFFLNLFKPEYFERTKTWFKLAFLPKKKCNDSKKGEVDDTIFLNQGDLVKHKKFEKQKQKKSP